MKSEKSCGVVIFRVKEKQLEFLLLKSKKNENWGFPKGHVEGKETEYETALREVKEECDLEVNIIEEFKVSTQYLIKENTIKEVVYFVGTSKDSEVHMQKSEIIDYAWLDLDKSLALLDFDNLKDILIKANQFIKKRE